MTQDKKITYALAVVVAAGLLCVLFLGRTLCVPISAIFLAAMAMLVYLLVKKRRPPSINRWTVLLLTVVFILLYLTVFYLSGLRLGFVKTTVPLNMSTLIRRVIPAATVIVASEVIRYVLILGEKRVSGIFAFLIALLSEAALAGGLWNLDNFNALMDMVGLTLLPAVSTGVLCHFLSARYGVLPSVAYRLLPSVIPLLIPIAPDLPDVIRAFAGLLLPLLLLAFIRLLFEKRVKRATASRGAKRAGAVATVLCAVLAIGFTALISCQFKYGTIVIASGSMTGELNVGDAIIYERFEDQQIDVGDVLVFEKNKSLVVHRVVEIKHINGQTQYYTKGDANENRDVGFITSNDIVGITDFKISYIGYPSLWMQSIFEIGS